MTPKDLWDFIWAFCSCHDRMSATPSSLMMIRASEPLKKWARGQHFRVNDCDFITFSLNQNNVSSDWTDSALDAP
jgi:hypothetical protein